jgi:hypothetical protein
MSIIQKILLKFTKLTEEVTGVDLFTHPQQKGINVWIDDSKPQEKVVYVPIDQIVQYTSKAEFESTPGSVENIQNILADLKRGDKMPPLIVHRVNLAGVSNPRYNDKGLVRSGGQPNSRFKYQVLDVHHRLDAYQKYNDTVPEDKKIKEVPVIIVPDSKIRLAKIVYRNKGG